ncbi:geranylgeranyl reductase family protein [Taibaiella koreensis]|uniref:geranylgeranyl reductase family protein n=1 Tax=Taibaiella koreensis TaxID=1268548 RepID=UPI000E59B485|nr:geranylgeranyl reductase family protein [Taibaiella koreensis]
MNTFTPVIIIGCGPAGAGASLFLSRAGIPHIILEKDAFPRDKVCGDGCSGKTAFVLRKADPALLDEIFSDESRFLPSFGVTFAAPNGKSIDVPFSAKHKQDRPPGFTSRRLDFDHFLFSKIQGPHARIIQNATVTGLSRTEQGYAVSYRNGATEEVLHCSLLIGADGDKGISRRQLLDGNAPSKTSSVGLRAYYEGVTGMHPQHFIELHFLNGILPGYFWIFPLPGGAANVGIGMDTALVRKKKINLREVMLEAISSNPNIRDRFTHARLSDKIYGWGLPMGVEPTKVSGDHFMITGDAASLIDPFTGEGIGNALYSGMLAAEAAEKALQAQRFDEGFLREQYGDVLFRRIGDELKLSYTMQKLVRYPWLFNLVVNKAHKSPALRNTLSSMFADLDVRALLRQPSFYWKVLTNK